MKLRRLLIFLAYGSFLVGAFAAEKGDDAKPETLSFDFSVFPLEPANWEGIYVAPDGDPEKGLRKLVFNPHERTSGYSYRGPAPLRFFRKAVDPEGEEYYPVVGELALRPTKDDLIFFFSLKMPGDSDGPYRVQYMVDSNYTFPEDSIVFFNSTGATFYGLLGSEKIVLSPGASQPTDVTEFFDQPAPIALVIRDGDQIRKVLVNKIRFSPERRTLMILRSPKSATSLRIRTQRLTEYMGEVGNPNDPGA